jgi:hypothetical protein
MKRRVNYIVSELAECQDAHGDGYVAGFDRRRGDVIENGKLLFPELMKGDIRSQGFDLNGCWVPFYNWHKLFDGLFHAETHCGNTQAVKVATGLGNYIDTVFAVIPDENVQTILDCEHGGINESFAELYARTGEVRWLALAHRLRHRKVLDPLSEGKDSLPYIHANTQIPKIIGLGRIYEVSGDTGEAATARFFWNTVINHYTYVIGGNADREYFPSADSISRHITEQTCESCNTYNMLKLTRQLFSWAPQAQLFDYYERAHINHILAQQDPETGMFAYMVPLMSGQAREYSTPYDSFWCCVGTGMESHAKHGDSIYWHSQDMLFINLFIPSELNWGERNVQLKMVTEYPFDETIRISIEDTDHSKRFPIALRIPAWAKTHSITVNGKPVKAKQFEGYAVIDRKWAKGDQIEYVLPLDLQEEATGDDPGIVALLKGPVVLAADMGPADADPTGSVVSDEMAPVFVSENILAGLTPIQPEKASYIAGSSMKPAPLPLSPFYRQTHQRTAVYFNKYTPSQWEAEKASLSARLAADAALKARTVDTVYLGQMQAERDHNLESNISYPTVYRGLHGRDVRSDGFFDFDMSVDSGNMVLMAKYWGDERNKDFRILVDGTEIAHQTLNAEHPGEFFTVEYPIPEHLTKDKKRVRVRFRPSHDMARGGPVYGVVMMRAE